MPIRNNLEKQPDLNDAPALPVLTAKEHIAAFAGRHRFMLAYAIMIISSLFLIPALSAGMQGDVNLYQGVANDFLAGKMPYRDRVVEYPPYAVPIFLMPRIFGEDNYLEGFMVLALVADWLVKLLLFALGARDNKGMRSFLPLLLYCMGFRFSGSFFFSVMTSFRR